MSLPTKPIGGSPRPQGLFDAFAAPNAIDFLCERAIQDTVASFPVLALIRDQRLPGQRRFLGVFDPRNPRVETDDCGFALFCDDTSTNRSSEFTTIRARILGTALAAEHLGGR